MDDFEVAYFQASVETVAVNRDIAEWLGLTHPILSDTRRDVARAYGVLHDGRTTAARWTFYIGIDGRILDIDRKVPPASRGAEIPGRLAALGIPRR